MIKCLFTDTNKEYYCEYEIKDNEFFVRVDYDVEKEIEKNGCICIGNNTHFKKRDIIIMDEETNYLLKNATCIGPINKYSTGLSYCMSEYKAKTYISNKDISKLLSLKKTPKIKKIIINSDDLSFILGNHVVTKILKFNKDKRISVETIEVNYEKIDDTIDVNFANIKKINIGNRVIKKEERIHDIKIHEYGCIELEFIKRVKYTDLYEYINELLLYVQLFLSNRITILSIYACIDESIYRMNNNYDGEFTNRVYFNRNVEESIGPFLKKCYQTIDYRNNSDRLRNIYGIITKQTRNIEDDFLLYYRFIECYYKAMKTNKVLERSINEHYTSINSKIEIKKMAAEIVNLRNHYVHSGYHIKGKTLKIDGKKFGIDSYIINNADINWIYHKTCILYKIAIDIIYKDILCYDKYTYVYKYNDESKLEKYE